MPLSTARCSGAPTTARRRSGHWKYLKESGNEQRSICRSIPAKRTTCEAHTRRSFNGSEPNTPNGTGVCCRDCAPQTPSGTRDRIQRPEPLALRRQQRQPERLQAVDERAMIPLVPRPARLEPFLLHDRQRLVERADERATTSCGGTCAGASSPRAAADRNRSCGTSRAARARAVRTTTGARPDGAPRHFCVQL